MRRIAVNVDSGGFGGCTALLQRPLHGLDRFQRDAGVQAAIEPEDRRFQLTRQFDGMLRRYRIGWTDQATVPSDTSLHGWVVGTVQPGNTPPPSRNRSLPGE